jgi:hypothetical protein
MGRLQLPQKLVRVTNSGPPRASATLIHLHADWAIGADRLQWIVFRRRWRLEESYWNPVSYVASTKRVLCRVLREKHVLVDEEGWQNLERLPNTFREYSSRLSIFEKNASSVEK